MKKITEHRFYYKDRNIIILNNVTNVISFKVVQTFPVSSDQLTVCILAEQSENGENFHNEFVIVKDNVSVPDFFIYQKSTFDYKEGNLHLYKTDPFVTI